jgi:two-component system cell cycle sensor histidine kinase/response regulator CckA
MMMKGEKFDRHLKALEQRFQALRDQAGGMPEARQALAPVLQEVAQAIAELRAAQETGRKEPPRQPEVGQDHDESVLHQDFRSLPDVFSIIDLDFNVLTANWPGYDEFKKTASSGQLKCYQLFHHRDHPCVECHIPQVLATRLSQVVEKLNLLDNRTYETVAIPIMDQSGRIIQVAEHCRDISALREAEKSLKEREELYSVLSDRSLAGVYLLQDGKFRYANPRMAQIFGYAPEEIINRLSPRDLIYPEDHPVLDDQIRRRLSGEAEEAHYTARGVRRDGTIIHLEFLGRRIDYQGRPAIVGTLLDITERTQSEEALREAEQKFRSIFDNATYGILIADPETGKFHLANPMIARMLGYSQEELQGLGIIDIHPPDSLAEVMNAFERLERQESSVVQEITVLRKDGSVFYADISATHIHIKGKLYLAGIFQDITARKQAKEALQTQARVLESMSEAVTGFSEDGRIVFANPAAYTMFGYPEGELTGQPVTALNDLPVEKSERFVREIIERLQREGSWSGEIRNRTKDGISFITYARITTLELPEKKLWISVQEDITAHKHLAKATRKYLQFIELLMETIPNPIFYEDAQGILLGCNKAFAEHAGVPQEEIPGKTVYDFSPGEVARVCDAGALEALFHPGTKVRLDIQMPGRAGSQRQIVCQMAAFMEDSGSTGGVVSVLTDITELQCAQEAVRAREATLRTLIEANPESLFLLDTKGVVLAASEVGAQRFGKSLDEIVGANVFTLFPPDVAKKRLALFKQILATGQPMYYEERLGDFFFLEQINPVLSQGKVIQVAVLAVDISDLKRAEEAVQESEARLRAIFEHAPVGIVTTDRHGRFLQTNPAFQEILGYSAAELQGLTFQQILHPEDLPGQLQLRNELIAGQGQHYSIEERNLRKGGEIVWVNVMVSRLDNAQNGLRLVATIVDITARKRAEEALRESEQRFRLMAETIQDVFWIATPGIEKTKYVSPRYEQVWGRAIKELYQSPQTFLGAVHSEDRQRVKSEFLVAHDRGEPFSLEYRIIRPDGEVRWIHDRGFPVQGEQGQVILFTGVATDITERKTLEQQLLLAQKMEAVGRLAGGVAHDFNNLLMAITGYSELMKTKVLKGDPLYGYLEDILKTTDRAAALTGQLLTFSRRQIVCPQMMDLNRVVLDLERMLRRLIEEDIELKIITAPKLGGVQIDAGHLNQIIMNLVINARDAVPCEGRITVETAEVDFDTSRQTRSGLAQPGSYVMLQVSDTGMGMDEAVQAHIFEPFFTTKEPGKGTGLGLSTVYGIVKQSGGFIDLDSESGKGSTFKIYLPRLDAGTKMRKVKVAKPTQLRGIETVLLVEDEDVLRTLLAKFLRLHGYTVLEARHGGEALLICEQHQGPIHLMVTDVVMPQMSGRVLADRLTPLRPEMKVLYMSGYTEDEVVQRGVAEQAVAFLQKPFRPIELVHQVHTLLKPQTRR